MNRKLGAIILAAGKGKRMNSTTVNKVVMHLADKPIILHILHFMKKIGIGTTIVVVGFAEDSVRQVLDGETVFYAQQKEQLGTGHAVETALEAVPSDITDVFVVYGDDAVFYNEKNLSVLHALFQKHFDSDAAITFLTIEQDDPAALGRIVRDSHGKLLAIVEEKDATDEQRKIKEINPGCFVFRVDFLNRYFNKLQKSPVTGEYYINSFIDLALANSEKVETMRGGKLVWRGMNTPEELQEAERLLLRT